MLCCQKLGEKKTITKYCRTCTSKFMKSYFEYLTGEFNDFDFNKATSPQRVSIEKEFLMTISFVFFLSLWHAAFVMYCQRHHTGRESVLPGPPPPTGVS